MTVIYFQFINYIAKEISKISLVNDLYIYYLCVCPTLSLSLLLLPEGYSSSVLRLLGHGGGDWEEPRPSSHRPNLFPHGAAPARGPGPGPRVLLWGGLGEPGQQKAHRGCVSVSGHKGYKVEPQTELASLDHGAWNSEGHSVTLNSGPGNVFHTT